MLKHYGKFLSVMAKKNQWGKSEGRQVISLGTGIA